MDQRSRGWGGIDTLSVGYLITREPVGTNIPWIGRSPQYLVKNEAMNRLYFGDNLKWLSDQKEFPDASVDLRTPTQLTKRTKAPII
jgi:hypothetical protein